MLSQESIIKEKSRDNFSIQCSILSSGKDQGSKTKKYHIECDFSKEGNMGSISLSNEWEVFEDKNNQEINTLDQNDAALLDENGNILDIEDASSNEADLEVTLKSLMNNLPFASFNI